MQKIKALDYFNENSELKSIELGGLDYKITNTKINDSLENVNFNSNEVVQDGLMLKRVNDALSVGVTVDTNDNIKQICANVVVQDTTVSPLRVVSFYDNSKNPNRYIGELNINTVQKNVWGQIRLYTSDDVYSTISFPSVDSVIGLNKISVSIGDNEIVLSVNGNSKKIDVVGYNELINRLIIGRTQASNSVLNDLLTYNRVLAPTEINHTLSVLNATHSINTINDYTISTDSSHIQMDTGYSEQEYADARMLESAKMFSTANPGDVDENGNLVLANCQDKSKILNCKMSGNTVKCIYADSDWITKDTLGAFNGSSIFLSSVPQIKTSSTYVLLFEVSLNTRSEKYKPCTPDTKRLVNETYDIDAGVTGLFKFVCTTKNSLDGVESVLTSMSATTTGTGAITFRRCLLEITDTSLVNVFMPFGLNSTQATIDVNGLKHSFYRTLEDKANGKVIELGGLDGARNTLEILKDGSVIYTQNTVKVSLGNNLQLSDITLLDAYDKPNRAYFSIKQSLYPTATNLNVTSVNVINSALPSISVNDGLYTEKEGVSVYNNIRFSMLKSQIATTEDMLSYIHSNQIDVEYILATPIVTRIQKEVNGVIPIPNKTIICSCDSAVEPSGLEVTVPVNKFAEMQTQIDTLTTLVNTLAVK